MARTFIGKNDVPKSLWAKVVNTANYVLNRCVIWPILKKAPYELFKSKKPNVSYLKAFGSKCFIHNNGKKNLSKFDIRTDEGIFVGYSSISKAYHVYNKFMKVIGEFINVTFDETKDDHASSSSFDKF